MRELTAATTKPPLRSTLSNSGLHPVGEIGFRELMAAQLNSGLKAIRIVAVRGPADKVRS